MLPPVPLERLSLPASPPQPQPPPFPLAASLAPVVVSLAIWAVTGSPYSLLFAALGPVVAVGGLFDGRRQRRRNSRRDVGRALEALRTTTAKIEAVHRAERGRRQRLAPAPGWDAASGALDRLSEFPHGPLPVLLGNGELPAIVTLDDQPVDPDVAPAVAEALARVRAAAAAFPDAPWLADARDGIAIIGAPALARAVARSLAFQALMRCPPLGTTFQAPEDERWTRAVPHSVTRSTPGVYVIDSDPRGAGERTSAPGFDRVPPVTIAWGRHQSDLPPALGCVLDLDRLSAPDGLADAPVGGLSVARIRGWRPSALGSARAELLASVVAEDARARGIVATARTLPRHVTLRELLGESADPAASAGVASLRAPIGRDTDGVVELDLVRDGPHAVVAGTTGTGKSELLVSWILAMASRHPPSVVIFLLVDFKGGAAFAPLADVPHVVGIVSDLDARRSSRAIESLRAELRRREAVLAAAGARSIDELSAERHPPLPRLVIVVDEFAAVVSGQPELHEVFADLAARGRSLGLHLILCTQRPAGVIRDGVLANVTLRISLRVTDRGDSLAMLGSEAASRLPVDPHGRAVIADGSDRVREVQLAIAEPRDTERVCGGSAPTASVWCEPLPEVIPLASLEAIRENSAPEGIVLGLCDLPAEQRQPVACHDPQRDGHLLVLGAARSGKTNALALFALAPGALVLPSDPADAWTALESLAAAERPDTLADELPGAVPSRRLLLLDDLDALVDRLEPELRHEFIERLERLAREARGLCLIAAAQRLSGSLPRVAGLFTSRILLRQPSRDEHVLAGGEGNSFDPRLPPGSGTWRGEMIQLALCNTPLSPPSAPPLRRVGVVRGTPLAIVAARPRELRSALVAEGVRIIELGEESATRAELRPDAGDIPVVLLGDPDSWQADWSTLSLARREFPVAVVGCTAAELRAVARSREVAPPLGSRPGECWLVEGGQVSRAILEL